jgi:predicted ATPase
MIHGVRFRNFKALRDVELPLDRFTVLVGPNASGKTSVLEGLHLLTRLVAHDPARVFEEAGGIGVIASRGGHGSFELGLTGTFRKKHGELSISFPAIEDYPFSDTYRLDSRWGERRFSTRRELSSESKGEDGAELPLAPVLAEAAYLRLDPAYIAGPSYSQLTTPVIGPEGSGVAAAVADMAVARPDEFARLQDALRAVIPGLNRLRLVRAKVERTPDDPAAAINRLRAAVGEKRHEDVAAILSAEDWVWGHEIVFDMAGATDIPARGASEGVLLMLGLFACLLGPERHELVLLDRLERAVHPRQLGELVAQINQVLALDPKLQIIATSDSPALLDHLAAEAVRVHCLLEDGSVRIKPLTAHPEYELLRHDMRPGEFLTQVGEAWVAAEPGAIGPDEARGPASDDDGGERRPPSMPPLPSGLGRL